MARVGKKVGQEGVGKRWGGRLGGRDEGMRVMRR
jgi:hypothetical protein